jgi:uncharacterized membrane protein YsdA (DUF1294 family)
MNVGTIVKASFFISLAVICVGVYQKISHGEYTEEWLIPAMITSFVFIFSAIYEVQKSKIRTSEKTMWTIAFIFSSGLAGLIYILFARKRVIKSAEARLYYKNSPSL